MSRYKGSVPGKRMRRNETEIGLRIWELRQASGLSGRDLAKICGCSPEAVSHWEHGYNEPSLSILNVMREAFHVSWDDFLGPAMP